MHTFQRSRFKKERINQPMQALGIFIILLLLSACGDPTLLKNTSAALSIIFSEGVNFQRTNYLHEAIEMPLKLEKDESINGLPTETLCLIGEQLLLVTHHGYLYILDANNLGNDDKIRLGRAISASPSLFAERCFIPLATGKYGLFVYDVYRGKIAWRLAGYLSAASPVIEENLVFHAALDGTLLCLNARTGAKIWESALGQKVENGLAYQSGNLFVASQKGIIRSLDGSSGSILWQNDLQEAIFCRPLILREDIFIATYSGNLYRINLTSGKIEQKKSFSNALFTSLSCDDSSLYVPGSDGMLFKLNPISLQEVWSLQLDGPFSAPVLVTPRWLIAGTAQNHLYLIDKDSAQIVQQIELEGRLAALPVIHKNAMIICYEYDGLALFKPEQTLSEKHSK